MSAVVIVEEGEGLALTLQLEKLQKEWEEKKARSVEVRCIRCWRISSCTS